MPDSDIDYLMDHVKYDQESGIFTSITDGERIGAYNGTGYRSICVDGYKSYEHRLAFFMINGFLPKEVDHKNGIRDDNRIGNLRAATHQQNIASGKLRKNNTSGKKGVHRHTDGRWRAKIQVNGKYLHIGLFVSVDEAHAAYVAAAKSHYGEFARSG